MQKALTQMNVQLANAISDVSGVTGQAIIRAILGGERAYLARLIHRILSRGEEWVDRGAAEFEKRRKSRQEQSLRRMAKDLGYTLTPAA